MEKEFKFAYYHAEGQYLDIKTAVEYHHEMENILSMMLKAAEGQIELWRMLLDVDIGFDFK